jgi:hypothetical protein
LERFLASSSRELGWTMEKYFEEIEYDLSIKNPTSRVLDLWKQWTTIATKFDLHETLEDPKGKKRWQEWLKQRSKRCRKEDGSERCCDYRFSTYHKSWSCEDQKFEGSGCPG